MALDLLTSVFTRLRPRLHSTARQLLASDDDADDAIQEAFYRLWQRRDRISHESQAEGMSVITVRNICIDSLRERQAHPHDTIDETCDKPEDNDPSGPREELATQVSDLINKTLSPRDREILLLRDRDGWDFDDIADRFGMTEAAVRVVISRARRTVRQCFTSKNHLHEK